MDTPCRRISTEIPCSFCSYKLVAPVYAFEDYYVCGRCDVSRCDPANKDKYTRQYLYENLGKSRLVTCVYKRFGCETKVLKEELDSHEKTCIYRKIKCPFHFSHALFGNNDSFCQWTGYGSELTFHIEKWHIDFILKNPIVPVKNCKQNLSFTFWNNRLFAILKLPAKDGLDIGVFSVCLSKTLGLYRYQFKLFDKYSCEKTLFRGMKILPLHDIDSHLSDRNGMFHLDSGRFASFSDEIFIKLTIGCNKRDKKHLLKDLPCEMRTELYNREKVSSVDKSLLKELECPGCKNTMVPPIYICKTGDSVCANCKSNQSKCPVCRQQFKGARNITLEKLITLVDYPCAMKSEGCFFTAPGDKIRQHEAVCSFQGKDCIFKCKWNGKLQDMLQHVDVKHRDQRFTFGSEHKLTLSSDSNYYLFAGTDDEVFRVAIKNDWIVHGNVKFAVQQVGYQRNVQYRYEVNILDKRGLGMKCLMSFRCQPATKHGKASFFGNCITLTRDCLNHFIFEDCLHYNIDVYDANH